MMDGKLRASVRQAQRLGSFRLITRDSRWISFVEYCTTIELCPSGQVAISGWFYPTTLGNLQHNKEICFVVWDTGVKAGTELLGKLVAIDDLVHANGRTHTSRIPPSKKRLMVKIEQLIELNQENYLLLAEEASLLR